MRIWYGQRGWGWRLWGITFGGARVFIGVSMKDGAEEMRIKAKLWDDARKGAAK